MAARTRTTVTRVAFMLPTMRCSTWNGKSPDSAGTAGGARRFFRDACCCVLLHAAEALLASLSNSVASLPRPRSWLACAV